MAAAGVLAGGKDMLLSKMLFGPFIELMNNRNYFGQEIWDTNAPGYQQVQQALRHIVSQQLSPMRPGHRRPADRDAAGLSRFRAGAEIRRELGLAEPDRVFVQGARGSRQQAVPLDEADTRARILARNNLLLAQQSGYGDKLSAAVRDMLVALFVPQCRSDVGRFIIPRRAHVQTAAANGSDVAVATSQPEGIRALFPALRQERDDQAVVRGTSAGSASAGAVTPSASGLSACCLLGSLGNFSPIHIALNGSSGLYRYSHVRP